MISQPSGANNQRMILKRKEFLMLIFYMIIPYQEDKQYKFENKLRYSSKPLKTEKSNKSEMSSNYKKEDYNLI